MLDLELLESLVQSFHQTLLPAELARAAADAARSACGAPVALALVRDHGGQVHVAAAGGPPPMLPDLQQAAGWLPDAPFSGPVAAAGPWREWASGLGMASVTGAPLGAPVEALGLLLACSAAPVPPAAAALRLVAAQAGAAAQRCWLHGRERQAVRQLQELRARAVRQQQALERLVALQRRFTAAGACAEGFTPLVATLGECLGGPLLLLDRALRVLAAYTPPVSLEGAWVRTLEQRRLDAGLADRPTLQNALRALLAGEGRPVPVETVTDPAGAEYWLAGLRSGVEVWGFLLWRGSPPPLAVEAEQALELGGTALALAYFHQSQGPLRPARPAFLEPLLTGQYVSSEAIREQAGRAGCDLSRVTRLVLADPEPGAGDADDLQVLAEGVAAGFGLGTYTTTYGGAVVVLVEADVDARHLARAVQERLRTAGAGPVTIGVSRPLRDLADIRIGYDEVRRSLALARRLGRAGTVIALEELGVYRVLLAAERSLLEETVQQVLGPLLRSDQAQAAQLLPTLAAYIRSGGSLQQTAEQCYVHLNTVKYRLKRAAELLGTDLGAAEERFKLDFALRAWEVLNL